jgi:hypothetical protein
MKRLLFFLLLLSGGCISIASEVMFVPYKEVLQLYEMGLNVPDYVTLWIHTL